MTKRQKVIDIKSKDFIDYINGLSLDELLYLKNKVDDAFELHTSIGNRFTDDKILKTLVAPARNPLNTIFKEGMKTDTIIRNIENKTRNISKSWDDIQIYDLDNKNRPYLFELLTCDEKDIISVRGINVGFMNKFNEYLNKKGLELNMNFTEEDYKKLFMYAKKGGFYKISIPDEQFGFYNKPKNK